AAEQRREGGAEVLVDRAERLVEALARGLLDTLDRFAGLLDRLQQVGTLRGQERVALLEFGELLDGHHVDRPEPLDLLLQLGDGVLWRQRRLRGHFAACRFGGRRGVPRERGRLVAFRLLALDRFVDRGKRGFG